ncbi:MAG: PAS domain-containing protein [Desulfobacteraceae bacterium]|nr:PAS domain-containing protein [Desulfobacteraceae bacterium]
MHDIIDTLVKNTQDLAAITDTSGNLLYLNSLAGKILKIPEDAPPESNLLFGTKNRGRLNFNRIIAHREADGTVSCFSFHLPGLLKENTAGKTSPSPGEEKLKALIDASKTIFSSTSIEEVLESTLGSACILTGCRMSAYCEIPRMPEKFFPVRRYCTSDDIAPEQAEAVLNQAALLLNYEPFLKALENQATVRVLDVVFQEDQTAKGQEPEKFTSCTMIFTRVPGLKAHNHGVILTWDPDKNEFREGEETLLEELSSFASLALGHFQSGLMPDHMSMEMDQIFSALAESVIAYDKTGAPVMANPAAMEMLGFDPVDMSGEAFIQKKALLYPTGRPVPFDQLPCQRALAGSSVRGETYLRTDARGLERIYEFNAVPLIHNNRVAGAVTVARDETERNRLMDQLETERTALQAIINNAPEAIVVVDEECRVVMTNPAAQKLYKHSPEYAQSDASEISPSEIPYDPVDLPLARSVFQGEMIVDHELTTCLPDGEFRHILVNTAPIRNPGGEITGAVGVFHDITQRKRERLELRRARDELEKRVEERTYELRHLSHRMLDTLESDRQKIAKELHDSLGASLAAIKFSLEEKLAHMQPDPPDNIMSLENIISYLMDTIKETKRISASLRPTILDDLGLLATITWFCREFNTFYQDIKIIEQIDIEEEEIEEALKIVIYRIMQEAMNNAAKHARPETIVLCLKKNSGRIELAVTDDGCGFDPQSRLNSPDPMSGHGIQGMKERAKICGGEFRIQSKPGIGTAVSVSFPSNFCTA